MQKEYVPVECNKIACTFYNNCHRCATEIVRMREEDPAIDIMFIGQGAGAQEDANGRPFQGPAGKLLRQKVKPLLETHQLNIILDNTIRSRPLDENGKNRAPTDKELTFCLDFVWQRIETYKPTWIIPLGSSATASMLPDTKGLPIGSVRGRDYNRNGYKFLPTYHPAAILHCSEQERKGMLEAVMCGDIAKICNSISFNSNLL